MPSWNGVLRAALEADVDRVAEFYKKHAHDNVLGRDAETVRRAVQEGRQFLVEVADEVAAVSGIFPYEGKALFEVGGTRVAEVWGGFKLQQPLFWARFGAIVVTEEDLPTIITVIDPEKNEKSTQAALDRHFEVMSEPDPVIYEECAPAEGRKGCAKFCKLPQGKRCCSTCYHLPRAALKRNIQELLEATQSGPLKRERSNGDVLLLKIDCVAITKYKGDLEDFIRE